MMRYITGMLEAALCTWLIVLALDFALGRGALWAYYDVCTIVDNFLTALGGR